MARRHVELCRRLPPEQTIVSTVQVDGADAFDAGEGYRIVRQPFTRREGRTLTNQLRWSNDLVRLTRDHGVTLLHLGNIRPCGYAVLAATARHPVPYLVYVNGGDLLREREQKARRGIGRWGAQRILGRASGIVANSAWTADLAREVMRLAGVVAPPPVAAIDLGTDPVQFSPARNTGALRRRLGIGDAPLLVTIARLVPHKGQDIGLEALAALGPEHGQVRYLIVGGGEDRARLEAHARALGVRDRVVFAGNLPDADVAEAYATATIYVGLSRLDHGVNVEGFGLSFVEASASGIPVVAGDAGGARSAVRDGETGLVVPPTDVAEAAGALRTLLANPAGARAMGANGRRAVEEHYNWDRTARETMEFAQRVLSHRVA